MNLWYKNLKKAPWTPPDYLFKYIWGFLYILMFLSLYFIWINKKCYPFCKPLLIFGIQLFLNLIWTTIFFEFKKTYLALIDIIFIIYFTYLSIKEFYNINPLSSYLLIPYLIWLLVALSLNIYIIIYNKNNKNNKNKKKIKIKN